MYIYVTFCGDLQGEARDRTLISLMFEKSHYYVQIDTFMARPNLELYTDCRRGEARHSLGRYTETIWKRIDTDRHGRAFLICAFSASMSFGKVVMRSGFSKRSAMWRGSSG